MDHTNVINALRAALNGEAPEKARRPRRERQQNPTITVTVNGRPADNIGPSVTVSVTTATISRLEAELAAFKEAARRHLRACVITRIERTTA